VQLGARLDASLDVAAAMWAPTQAYVATTRCRALLREVPPLETTSMEVLRSSVARVAAQSDVRERRELVAFVVLHAVKAVGLVLPLDAARPPTAPLQAELRELVRRRIGVSDRGS
jgi:hypothetical protein